MEHVFTIRSGNLELAATLHDPSGPPSGGDKDKRQYPIVVICHGFVGNRIGIDRLFVKAARHLAGNGYRVLRFDYGGCGESTGDYGAGGMDSLIEQTRHVLDYAASDKHVDPERVVLLGHSLGGAVALLTAAQDHRVKSLVLWSAVANPFTDIVRIIGEKKYERIRQTQSVDYRGYSLTGRFFGSLAEYQPLMQLRNFSGNVLLVHGSDDREVPVEYCFLYQRAFWLRPGGRCDKEVILGADHTFSSASHTERLLKVTCSWLDADRRNAEWTDRVI